MNETIHFFNTKTTEEIAQFLLGMYLEHKTEAGTLAGYIVDTEAYLGPDDEAAHSFGLRKTPRLRAMYEKPGTIYLYTMHTHLILNMVTKDKGIPQGVMIRAIEPVEGLELMEANRNGRKGAELSNGPGKLVSALGITKDSYGQSIFDSTLRIVPEKRKQPKKIMALPRIGIPNKGIWTELPLRYVVSGNPYISKQKRSDIDQKTFGWKEEIE
ncbi:DNA-3-methyladenine glycosylase [Enterococcus sp. DIV0242_7C1]|uniref:Putative 3-methyladenine DNA glycosylase n=1 Tax=Candidatus Enterococcus dunnyi TaxID=1834192 RepID=A0A200J855_9ENTE|nr:MULTISPECIES: DNA-3-methyladenine glycosylase [unclassified Enterococcus]MBO0470972.1 DNA-3-methyladenine glycosylase [Enterococcus sp. DIV0242_7C1]MCA5013210.1 DNA-3-methyladenine glycosylase [Enterococcus sp. S23]MCA5016460.1 DNA-3-methyladenine glycosylase [Enterococcus sp. S22(2020)]OUZ33422.1 DNA-3-methyladenine glycosylase [Enterococcus sp. 9D6_DIV0238]